MSEDWMLDEEFRVESARDFISDLSPDEKEFLYHGSNMKFCPNCGEFVSKTYNGKCNLCGQSKTHARIRGSSNNAEENKNSFLELVEEFNNRTGDSKIISSDDPTAIEKIESKIEILSSVQERMKKANKIVRSKKMSKAQKIKELEKIEGLSKNSIDNLFVPDYIGRIGFPAFELKNNSANIRRLKDRLEKLNIQRSQDTTSETINEVKIIDNVEANRLQLFFPITIILSKQRNYSEIKKQRV